MPLSGLSFMKVSEPSLRGTSWCTSIADVSSSRCACAAWNRRPGRRADGQSGFTVQRAWSNRAAERGRNPCLPPDRPYVALVPREPAVRLPNVGDSATLVVDTVADRPTDNIVRMLQKVGLNVLLGAVPPAKGAFRNTFQCICRFCTLQG